MVIPYLALKWLLNILFYMPVEYPMQGEHPWGTRTAGRSNPYKDMPYTGVTRYYNWTISKTTLAPDGYGNSLS